MVLDPIRNAPRNLFRSLRMLFPERALVARISASILAVGSKVLGHLKQSKTRTRPTQGISDHISFQDMNLI